jgi:hypothetical protein
VASWKLTRPLRDRCLAEDAVEGEHVEAEKCRFSQTAPLYAASPSKNCCAVDGGLIG